MTLPESGKGLTWGADGLGKPEAAGAPGIGGVSRSPEAEGLRRPEAVSVPGASGMPEASRAAVPREPEMPERGRVTSSPKDRMCTAALVLGILGVVVPFAELALSAPAILCGLAGLRRVAGGAGRIAGRERAMAGVILGLIGLLLCVPSAFVLIRMF